LSYLQGIHKTVPLKTIDKDKKAKKELKKMGGKAQIPCLMINGQALYESEAIIQWLSQHQDLLDSVS
jgi:glutathione S-transferase